MPQWPLLVPDSADASPAKKIDGMACLKWPDFCENENEQTITSIYIIVYNYKCFYISRKIALSFLFESDWFNKTVSVGNQHSFHHHHPSLHHLPTILQLDPKPEPCWSLFQLQLQILLGCFWGVMKIVAYEYIMIYHVMLCYIMLSSIISNKKLYIVINHIWLYHIILC